MLTVAKFGGTSLRDGAAFLAVRQILLADSARRAVVVSAPGRRFEGDPKITDLLYLCHERRSRDAPWQPVFRAVAERFRQICRDTGAFLHIEAELDALYEKIEKGVTRDYLASRGEYFSALILAGVLGWKFVDSAQWLRFGPSGAVDPVRSYGLLRKAADAPFVTPGFYGVDFGGAVKTFPRGGSDITGALVAAALDADLYENWTDVPGVLRADPREVPDPAPVSHLTYGELAELAAVGTQVLHQGAVSPVASAGIPLQIRCTFRPEEPGTLISSQLPAGVSRSTLLCLSSLSDRTLVSLQNAPSGTLAAALGDAGVQADFLTEALGRQTASVPSAAMTAVPDVLRACPGEFSLQDGLAILAVIVAREEQKGPSGAELLTALAEKKIPVHAILRPFGGHTLLLAVPQEKRLCALGLLAGK